MIETIVSLNDGEAIWNRLSSGVLLQLSPEPYRADVALIHVSEMKDTGEETTVGRFYFTNNEEMDFLAVLEKQSQLQTSKAIQSVLYPDDHLFTLFDDGHVEKTKISCIGD